jgi:hypothetical protein
MAARLGAEAPLIPKTGSRENKSEKCGMFLALI